MKPVHTFTVVPSLPARLERLRELAYNLRWAWDHPTIELFRRLEPDLWETSGHNPVRMLGEIDQKRLDTLARDDAFLANLDRVWNDLSDYLGTRTTWFRREFHETLKQPADRLIAYFSAEFGLTECLSIFAGGLGILAGDHLKSASDLGVPIIGVGLLYQQGYFRQYLNAAGWQQESYEHNNFRTLPLQLEGRTHVPFPGRNIHVQIWRAQVGRVPLYLLDTNVAENSPADRDITDQLYGGDSELRLRQEYLLGMGGCLALEALGLTPTVYHMNEGHSAFLALERIKRLMREHQLSFAEAKQIAAATLVFTTHTPVPAGHDYFAPDLIDRYFAAYYSALGIGRDEFLALGRHNPHDSAEPFCMTVLALRLAPFRNGVSRLHGAVTRRMFADLWPSVPAAEIPIGHVTNGVHFRSWISQEMNELYVRYLGPGWAEGPADEKLWRRSQSIPAEELWRTHERRRERLVAFARRRLLEQLRRRGAPASDLTTAEEALDPKALTIGFARRFATYKRATLLFRDPKRLAAILNHPNRPVQLLFAGKAHPRDEPGKDFIREIIGFAHRPEFRQRIVFLEDYDMSVARAMVQGADVWLNTPRRPLEASGTSGMKAVANGVLNVSILDGWWAEAWDLREGEPFGWAIGNGEEYGDTAYQDQVEAEALYDLLEREIVPAFYDRGGNTLPRKWIARMKSSIAALCPVFNTHRMVQDYTRQFYLVADANMRRLTAEGALGARELAAWTARVTRHWGSIHIQSVTVEPRGELRSGEQLRARALVRLGELSPSDVLVEAYIGLVSPAGDLQNGIAVALNHAGADTSGLHVFEGPLAPAARAGLHGITVRAMPYHSDGASPFLPGLIAWADARSAGIPAAAP